MATQKDCEKYCDREGGRHWAGCPNWKPWPKAENDEMAQEELDERGNSDHDCHASPEDGCNGCPVKE